MLRLLEPGPEVQRQLAARLSDSGSTLSGSALSRAKPSTLGLAAPHPVFNLGLEAIDLPDWIEQPLFTGWRYFVTSGDKIIATAEASVASPSGPVKGTLTNEGLFVMGAGRALESVEQRPEIESGEYDLALLRVPALSLMALWLKSVAARTGDRFVPVDPAPLPMQANSWLDPSHFVQQLRGLKKARESAVGADDEAN